MAKKKRSLGVNGFDGHAPTSNKKTERTREYRSTWKWKIYGWKYNAKKREREWDLTLEDLQELLIAQNNRCYYTGKTMTMETGCKNTISLDRIDNKRGYTKDNIVFCCWDVNYMKGVLDADRFIKLCNYVSWIHPIEREI